MLENETDEDIVSHLYMSEAYYFNPKVLKRHQVSTFFTQKIFILLFLKSNQKFDNRWYDWLQRWKIIWTFMAKTSRQRGTASMETPHLQYDTEETWTCPCPTICPPLAARETKMSLKINLWVKISTAYPCLIGVHPEIAIVLTHTTIKTAQISKTKIWTITQTPAKP